MLSPGEDQVMTLCCGHGFHEECIEGLMRRTGVTGVADVRCPVCKKTRHDLEGLTFTGERGLQNSASDRTCSPTLERRTPLSPITPATPTPSQEGRRPSTGRTAACRAHGRSRRAPRLSPMAPSQEGQADRPENGCLPPLSPITPVTPAAHDEPHRERSPAPRGGAAARQAAGSSPMPEGCSAASGSTIARGDAAEWATRSPGGFTPAGPSSQSHHYASPATPDGGIPPGQPSPTQLDEEPPPSDPTSPAPSTPTRRSAQIPHTQTSPAPATQGGHPLPTVSDPELGFLFRDYSRAGDVGEGLSDPIPSWIAACTQCSNTKTTSLLHPARLFAELKNEATTYKTVMRQAMQTATHVFQNNAIRVLGWDNF